MFFEDFSIEAVLMIDSPKEAPNNKSSTGIISAVFFAFKLKAGVIKALLFREMR